ncbi:unnamed protein product [Miscanthus lutarioriparius]|uniref:Pre-rRNA-processing protein TSR2 homolog n=1 Tax=Miscanthus lutarioriparius TaxID=422564 RepID=A0A811M950_9POAL|nr:unnamed protein product [Miscanthus lutarioriparius]
MASSSSSGTVAGAGGRVVLSKEGATAMAECIGLLFGRWTALQLADELEGLLYDAMDESFNADIEDGSVEEVTKHLMIMYTCCLRQNYSYIDKLRKTLLAGSAITQSKEVLRGYESSSDEISRSEEEDDDDE